MGISENRRLIWTPLRINWTQVQFTRHEGTQFSVTIVVLVNCFVLEKSLSHQEVWMAIMLWGCIVVLWIIFVGSTTNQRHSTKFCAWPKITSKLALLDFCLSATISLSCRHDSVDKYCLAYTCMVQKKISRATYLTSSLRQGSNLPAGPI